MLEFQTSQPPPDSVPQPQPKAAVFSDEKLLIVKEGVGRIVPIPWPANPRQWVGMRCLSRAEQRACYREATATAEREGRKGDEAFISKLQTDLVLWTALRDCVWIEREDGTLDPVRDNPAGTLIVNANRFAEVTTEKQVTKLIAHYDDIMESSTPLTRFQNLIQNNEFQQAWNELKKKPDARRLTGLSSGEAVALLIFIAHLFQDPPENSET